MSFSESDLSSILSKGHCKVAGNKVDPLTAVIRKHGFEGAQPAKKEKPSGKPQGGNLRLILPFRLPTWNRLLAMNQWERAKVRHWIHAAVSLLSPTENDSQTLTVSPSKLLSMGLSIEDYYRMITPKSSRKSEVDKNKAKKTRPSLK